MKAPILTISICILFFCAPSLKAQNTSVVDKIIELGKTDNQTMEHLDILSNRFGGRLIGSDAYENAAEWAAYKFKSWGMEVEMDKAGELPVGFNRGPWFGKMISENGMQLHFATPSYTSGTKGVQRGHVLLEPRSQFELNKMKGKLKGAWVLVGGTNNGMICKDSVLFYKQMVEAGILGIIQSATVPIKAMADKANYMDMTFETLPTVPDIKLDEHQYEIIKKMVEERRWFQLEFDIRNHFKLGPIAYHNVIGIIPGTEFPDQYVIMGAHLDAYDVATGGVDNGSGVSPVMEAARLIMEAGGKPKRTILVCLWAGEEFGLLGSLSWVARNKNKWDNISYVINRDDAPWVPSSIDVTEFMWEDMEKVIEPVQKINKEFPFSLVKNTPILPEKAYGSDHAPFSYEGIPAVNLGTNDPRGYDFDYREIWHTERDLFNKSIPVYQNHTSIVMAVLVYGIANLDYLLPRKEFYLKK